MNKKTKKNSPPPWSSKHLSDAEFDAVVAGMPKDMFLDMACRIFREGARESGDALLRLFKKRDDIEDLCRISLPVAAFGLGEIPAKMSPQVMLNSLDFLSAAIAKPAPGLFLGLCEASGIDPTDRLFLGDHETTRVEFLLAFLGLTEQMIRQDGGPRLAAYLENARKFYETLFGRYPHAAFPVSLESPFYDSGGDPLVMTERSGNSVGNVIIKRVRAEAEGKEIGTWVRIPEPPPEDKEGKKKTWGVV